MTERGHRERDAERNGAIAIGLIVAVAAALRFWALGTGLPSSLGVDEPQIMIRSLAMVRTGDFNPHFFDYPGFYLYLQAGVVVARFLAGASTGAWASLAQVSDYDFYLWGRAVTAVFGTATVYLVYLAGRRWGRPHALLAAALFAVLPIHVRESRFVLTDVPTTFFVALALVLSLAAQVRGTRSAFAWAGAAAGLAVGTKYTAWVSIVLPLAAAAMTAGAFDVRARRALTAAAAFAISFLIVAPYTVLDLPAFLNGFGALAAAVPKRAPALDPGWQVYLKHLRMAFGWPGSLLAGAGLILFAVRVARGPDRAGAVLVLVFLPAFWLMIVDRTLIFARYALPMTPFICLLAAVAVVSVARWLGRFRLPRLVGTALVGVLTVATIAQPAFTSISLGRELSRRTTLMVAADWILQNVRPGARIVCVSASMYFPPGRYSVDYATSLTQEGRDFYLNGQPDYVVATSGAYERYAPNSERYRQQYLAYQDLSKSFTPVLAVPRSDAHPGPEVLVFSVRK